MKDHIDVLISEEELQQRIKEIGAQITRDYEGEEVLLIGILKGAVYFLAEVSKRIELPVRIDFMQVSSYGASTESSGVVKIIKDHDETLEGRHVIIVEDIVDSGYTLAYLLDFLKDRHPASLKLCALLNKPERRKVEVPIDYCCFDVPDKFIVGYGLDYAQQYRNLPYIGVINND